jgi:hypothetical protein
MSKLLPNSHDWKIFLKLHTINGCNKGLFDKLLSSQLLKISPRL